MSKAIGMCVRDVGWVWVEVVSYWSCGIRGRRSGRCGPSRLRCRCRRLRRNYHGLPLQLLVWRGLGLEDVYRVALQRSG